MCVMSPYSTVTEYVCWQLDSVDRVIFCVFLNTDLDLYESWMQVYFPSTHPITANPADDSGRYYYYYTHLTASFPGQSG